MSTLPNRENTLFRSIVKCYELKQYKKGLKAADAVLKKFPTHGETLAMKGLVLNCMHQRDEAFEFVRKGLKYDLKSHVCWHVYGLLYRSELNYAEAAKCYRNAIRIDPTNVLILKDLCLLQLQTRDIHGWNVTRRSMLLMRPMLRANWLGLAISFHLMSKLDIAIDILSQFETQRINNPLNAGLVVSEYEASEIQLYKLSLMMEGGKFQEVADYLQVHESVIKDKMYVKELLAQVNVRLGNFDVAISKYYEDLLSLNSDNASYHFGLQCALSRDTTFTLHHRDDVKCLDYYDTKKQESNTNTCWEIIPLLDFKNIPNLKSRLDLYLKKMLRKGVPSLATEFIQKYESSRDFINTMEELVVSYVSNLEQFKKFDSDDESIVSSSTLLWTLYFAASHFYNKKDYDSALSYATKAVEHTPTLIDAQQLLGQIIAALGDSRTAATVLKEASNLDLADRFSNNLATKYALRANDIESARDTVSIFTKHENTSASSSPNSNLYDMQCAWYEVESGDAYARVKNYGAALRCYVSVMDHYKDMVDDQFDFHSYCLRKSTLRAYVSLLKFEDRIHNITMDFTNASVGAIKCYLSLHTQINSTSNVEKKKSKKEKAKARKAAYKENQSKNNNMTPATTNVEKKRVGKFLKDEEGKELVSKDPLVEASVICNFLKSVCPDRVVTHLCDFDVAFVKQKYVQCLKALVLGFEIDSENLELKLRLVKLYKSDDSMTLSSRVCSVLTSFQSRFFKTKSIQEYVNEMKTSESCEEAMVKLECLKMIKEGDTTLVKKSTVKLLLECGTLPQCEKYYTSHQDDEDFKTKCAIKFPYATAFGNSYKK